MTYFESTVAEFVELYKGLEAIKNVKGTRFAFLVAKNLKELEHVLKPYEDKARPSQEFQIVAAQAHKLAEAEDQEGIEKLEEEHKDLVEQRKQQLAEVEKEMQQTIKVALQEINEEQLPDDLSTEQLLPIMRLIK